MSDTEPKTDNDKLEQGVELELRGRLTELEAWAERVETFLDLLAGALAALALAMLIAWKTTR